MESQYKLDVCPHCGVNKPRLDQLWNNRTASHDGISTGEWGIFMCSQCGKVTMVNRAGQDFVYPGPLKADDELPSLAKDYLQQAMRSLHAPSGAIMLSASAIDSMLKSIGYDKGSLFDRIDKAANDHKITASMAEWAHKVRLDANEQRHPDKAATLPTQLDAQNTISFAEALGEFLFALPQRVSKGIEAAEQVVTPPKN